MSGLGLQHLFKAGLRVRGAWEWGGPRSNKTGSNETGSNETGSNETGSNKARSEVPGDVGQLLTFQNCFHVLRHLFGPAVHNGRPLKAVHSPECGTWDTSL